MSYSKYSISLCVTSLLRSFRAADSYSPIALLLYIRSAFWLISVIPSYAGIVPQASLRPLPPHSGDLYT